MQCNTFKYSTLSCINSYNLLTRARQLILGFIDFFHKPFASFIPAQTFRYLACGGSNTVLNIFLDAFAFNTIMHRHPATIYQVITISAEVGAWALSYPINIAIGFTLSRYIVFPESNLHGHKQLFRYTLIAITFVLISFLLIEAGKIYLPMVNQTVRYTLVCIIITLFSYISQRKFTFMTVNEIVIP